MFKSDVVQTGEVPLKLTRWYVSGLF